MPALAYRSPVPPAVLYLRAHREAAGLSINALALQSGVARSTVYRLETELGGDDPTGRRIDMRTLGELAQVLGVDPGALFAPPKSK